MSALSRYLAPLNFSAREIREEGASLPPEYIERILNPKPPSEHERRNAEYAAMLLEEDRKHG